MCKNYLNTKGITVLNNPNEQLYRYLKYGAEPPEYIRRILEVDIVGAFNFSTGLEKVYIPDIIRYVYSQMPAETWGNSETVNKWIKLRGIYGMQDEKGR